MEDQLDGLSLFRHRMSLYRELAANQRMRQLYVPIDIRDLPMDMMLDDSRIARAASRLPVRKITEQQAKAGNKCMICYEQYKEDETVKTLPCFHFYHVKCIGEWFNRNHDTCPECRFSIINNGERDLLNQLEDDNETASDSDSMYMNMLDIVDEEEEEDQDQDQGEEEDVEENGDEMDHEEVEEIVELEATELIQIPPELPEVESLEALSSDEESQVYGLIPPADEEVEW